MSDPVQTIDLKSRLGAPAGVLLVLCGLLTLVIVGTNKAYAGPNCDRKPEHPNCSGGGGGGGGGSDDTAPAQIGIPVVTQASTGIGLSWVATGDDGTSGTAASYVMEYDEACETAPGPEPVPGADELSPAASGSAESFYVDNLQPDTQNCISITAIDEAGNSSDTRTVMTETLGDWSSQLAYSGEGSPDRQVGKLNLSFASNSNPALAWLSEIPSQYADQAWFIEPDGVGDWPTNVENMTRLDTRQIWGVKMKYDRVNDQPAAVLTTQITTSTGRRKKQATAWAHVYAYRDSSGNWLHEDVVRDDIDGPIERDEPGFAFDSGNALVLYQTTVQENNSEKVQILYLARRDASFARAPVLQCTLSTDIDWKWSRLDLINVAPGKIAFVAKSHQVGSSDWLLVGEGEADASGDYTWTFRRTGLSPGSIQWARIAQNAAGAHRVAVRGDLDGSGIKSHVLDENDFLVEGSFDPCSPAVGAQMTFNSLVAEYVFDSHIRLSDAGDLHAVVPTRLNAESSVRTLNYVHQCDDDAGASIEPVGFGFSGTSFSEVRAPNGIPFVAGTSVGFDSPARIVIAERDSPITCN